MHYHFINYCSLLWCIALSQYTFAAQDTPLSVIEPFEYGIFVQDDSDINLGLNTSGLDDNQVRYQKIVQTSYIPGKKGVRFGVRYRLLGMKSTQPPVVRLIYLTPGLLDPTSNERIDKIELDQVLRPELGSQIIAFEFTEDWELEEGAWQFYVFFGSRKLLEQTFIVVK